MTTPVTKEFFVKDEPGFKIRVKTWRCASPSELNSVEFVNESYTNGQLTDKSTYNFFLTDAEIQNLIKGFSQ
jgi:hypothetical protein